MFLLSHNYWRVEKTKEKGRGVFAKKAILAGMVIGDYLGKILSIAEYDVETDKHELFLMYFTDGACIYPDVTRPGIHLINHSCTPNCWIYVYRGHTLFFALRDIAVKEELTISYLLSPKDKTCAPCLHVCKCGSETCTGFMHLSRKKYALWRKFRDSQQKGMRVAPFVLGGNLPRLDTYPSRIPGNSIYTTMISS